MAGGKLIYGGASNMDSFFVQSQRVSCSSSQPRDSLFMSSSSSSSLGSRSILSFEGLNGGRRSSKSFYQSFDQEENLDEELNEFFCQPEKKRRLTADQVLFLEKRFVDENKLEPERKVELAKELGLQPRQIAVWFQNRRARCKTKQLEKDYEALQASYNSLKADYSNLLKQKESLEAEVVRITDKLLMKGNENDNSKSSHSSSLTASPPKGSVAYSVSEEEVSKESAVAPKLEDISCGKSDVLDSDSPHYPDGVHSSLIEPFDSSYGLEHDQSDLSQDEEDEISKNLLHPAYIFPKIEEDAAYRDMPNSGYYEFPVDDQAFGFFWPY